MTVNDFETDIDLEYYYEDVKQISDTGLIIADQEVVFENCRLIRWDRDPAMRGRKCVGERNTLADPKYMKFICGGKKLILLFREGGDFYTFLDELRNRGYDMFDLS